MEQHPLGMITPTRALQTGRQVEGGLEKKSQMIMAPGKVNRGDTKENFTYLLFIFFPLQEPGSSKQKHKGSWDKAAKLWNVLPQDVVDTKL